MMGAASGQGDGNPGTSFSPLLYLKASSFFLDDLVTK